MDPVVRSVCNERHAHIDERCEIHIDRVDALEDKINCIMKVQTKIQWLIIATLVALVADIIRGMYVLENVMKVASSVK